jgi:transcriptional antiterminator RfaH
MISELAGDDRSAEIPPNLPLHAAVLDARRLLPSALASRSITYGSRRGHDGRQAMFYLRDRLIGSHWYVIRAHHKQEARAEVNLSIGGVETFLPWVRPASRRRARVTPREALFPQYLFARFDPGDSLHDVTFTRGVQSIVSIGGQLATVSDEVIEFFRSRIDEHGLIPIGRRLERGDRVEIESGPLADLTGVVERNLPARERVIVLLTSVGCPMRVELPADHLRIAPATPSAQGHCP